MPALELVVLTAVAAFVAVMAVRAVFRVRPGTPVYSEDAAVGTPRKIIGTVIAVLGSWAAMLAIYVVIATPGWAVSSEGACSPTTAAHAGLDCASANPKSMEFLLAPMLTLGGIAAVIGLSLARPSLVTDKAAMRTAAV